MRGFLITFLCLFSLVSFAQLNYSAKAYRSFNADSLTVKTETVGLELMYDDVGVMYYNNQSNKWRCYTSAAGWYDCSSSGGGGSGTVTSVGLTVGTTGTDIAISGSPITTSGSFTLDIPTASGTNRGALSSTDWTTFNNKGSVSSVGMSGGTTGLTYSGSPVTGSGTITTGGILNIANGGTGTATPALVAGTNITITGSWPNNTINATGGGGGFTTADNGLTASTATNVQLGGTLLQNTNIAGAAGVYNLQLGTSGSRLNDFSVYTDESIFLSSNSGFSYYFIDETTGGHSFQVGLSGSTSADFFVSNGSQTLANGSSFLRTVKTNPTITNTTPSILASFRAENSGADGANGYGVQINLSAENTTTGGNEGIGEMVWSYIDATSTSEDSEFHMNLLQGGSVVPSLSIQAVGSVLYYTLNDLPTSCAGVPAGVLANVAGVLTVCP